MPRDPTGMRRATTSSSPRRRSIAAKEAEAEDEREHFEGAETKADLDEEAGQANRPGTERPPV